ncbi:MAG: SDR family oxidoreductase [Myxococcota bacterium]|nr:SDR family oxidoreductase [Myxococcota bacterium]
MAEASGAPPPATARGEAPGRGRLEGRRILVVGAGRETHGLADAPVGNGQAMSRLAAREGAAVACADLHRERAREVVDEIASEAGPAGQGRSGRAVALGADASREEDVVRMLAEAREALGGLDGLVCNPGIGRGMGLEGTTAEDWDAVMATNVRSAFLCLKHGLPALPAGGAALLVSSVAGHRAGSRIPAYDASKAALSGLLRHAAREGMRRGVRVNAIVPGLIDTSLGRWATRGRPDRTARLPFGRQGTAWEVAYAAVFLLSDEASYVAGHELFVDAGLAVM